MMKSAPKSHKASRTAPPDLWLASSSSGKVREFAAAARSHGLEVATLPGFEGLEPCIEDGLTFEANARKKAEYYSRHRDGLVFADDSGISVDALGGRPGVFSARYSGAGATDHANNARLIAELSRALRPHGIGPGETPNPRAAAHYVCVIALARRGQVVTITEGRADGIIVVPPRGTGGFGYDPCFFFPPLGQTFAELTAEAKFAVSHRGEAFRKLLDYLERSR